MKNYNPKNIVRVLSFALVVLLSVTMLASCKKDPEPEVIPDYPLVVRETTVKQKPLKVLSLSPSVTSTMFELGLGGRLAGFSDNCVIPVGGLPDGYTPVRCGTVLGIDIAAVKKVMPDLIIAPAQMTDKDLRAVQQLNISVITLPAPTVFGDLPEYYTDIFRIMYGENLGSETAVQYLGEWNEKISELSRFVREHTAELEQTAESVYIGPGFLTLATGDTLEGEILALLGTRNAAEPFTRFIFPEENEPDLIPDIIFYNGLVTRASISASDYYKATPAVKNGRIKLVSARRIESRAPESLLREMWSMAEFLYGKRPAREVLEYEEYVPDISDGEQPDVSDIGDTTQE